MKVARKLQPVPSVDFQEEADLNRDLSRRELQAIRRRVERASQRPAPGSSDLLAASLWREEIGIGARTVRVYDCIGMPSILLKRNR